MSSPHYVASMMNQALQVKELLALAIVIFPFIVKHMVIHQDQFTRTTTTDQVQFETFVRKDFPLFSIPMNMQCIHILNQWSQNDSLEYIEVINFTGEEICHNKYY